MKIELDDIDIQAEREGNASKWFKKNGLMGKRTIKVTCKSFDLLGRKIKNVR